MKQNNILLPKYAHMSVFHTFILFKEVSVFRKACGIFAMVHINVPLRPLVIYIVIHTCTNYQYVVNMLR